MKEGGIGLAFPVQTPTTVEHAGKIVTLAAGAREAYAAPNGGFFWVKDPSSSPALKGAGVAAYALKDDEKARAAAAIAARAAA